MELHEIGDPKHCKFLPSTAALLLLLLLLLVVVVVVVVVVVGHGASDMALIILQKMARATTSFRMIFLAISSSGFINMLLRLNKGISHKYASITNQGFDV